MKIREIRLVKSLIAASAFMVSGALLAHVGEHLTSSEVAQVVTIHPENYDEELKNLITNGYDIAGLNVVDKTIDVLMGQNEFAIFSVQKANSIVRVKALNPNVAPDANYTTYAELTASLTATAAKYPDIMSVESIGKSLEGRDIWAVKISDNVGVHEADEPALFFNAMHHAREVMTTEVALDLIGVLTKDYATNERVKNWVNRNEVWIVPMINPDGNNKVWTSNSMWRKNARDGFGVDINRNYPYKWGACNGSSGSRTSDAYRGPSAASEPETQAVMNFVARIKPVMSISYHSYSELVIYPYGCDDQYTPDHEMMQTIGKQLASRLPRDNAPGTYKPGTSWEILYAVDGGDLDWLYSEHDVFPFVIEVNSDAQGFQPAFTWRQRTVEKMRAGWSFMFERLELSGIRGEVHTADGRAVTSGQVSIQPITSQDFEGQPQKTYRIKPDGTFHVILKPGMYKMKVASGSDSYEQEVLVGAARNELKITL